MTSVLKKSQNEIISHNTISQNLNSFQQYYITKIYTSIDEWDEMLLQLLKNLTF